MTSMFPAQLVIRAAGAPRRALTLTLTLSPDRRYAAGTPRRALTLTLTLTRARARARARALSPSLTLTLTRRDRTGDGQPECLRHDDQARLHRVWRHA